jgi:hypothetical protein
MAARTLTAEPLAVAPELVGRPLASPVRRFLALAVDLVVLLPPTIALSLVVALTALRVADPPAYRGLRTAWRGAAVPEAERPAALGELARLLVRIGAPGLPAEVKDAVERGDLAAAGRRLAECDLLFALDLRDQGAPAPRPGQVRVEVHRLIPDLLRAVTLYGLGAIYFTLLTAGKRGATLGKRLLGIRVACLNGHALSLVESLERFIGYLHIPGSFGLALGYLWYDPNRRMPHDRAAGTVVVRVPRTARPPRPAPKAKAA